MGGGGIPVASDDGRDAIFGGEIRQSLVSRELNLLVKGMDQWRARMASQEGPTTTTTRIFCSCTITT